MIITKALYSKDQLNLSDVKTVVKLLCRSVKAHRLLVILWYQLPR